MMIVIILVCVLIAAFMWSLLVMAAEVDEWEEMEIERHEEEPDARRSNQNARGDDEILQ